MKESSGISIEKFNTKLAAFDAEYEKKAHLQTTFNNDIIHQLSNSIKKWFPDTKDKPIKIVDLCCGHGKPTYELLTLLNKNGVNVEQITGYDISPSQIEQAQINYANDSRLKFVVQNIGEIKDKSEYDIAISLFGLHWMENISMTARIIFKSLKPNGKLMFFVPLEKMDLFELRKEFLYHSQWNQSFDQGYQIHPFIADDKEYLVAFDKYFQHEREYTLKGQKNLPYIKDEFATFLSSWLPEMRHLNSKNISSVGYDRELVESIPKDHQGNILDIGNNKIIFTEHFFSYQGSALAAILPEDCFDLMIGSVNDICLNNDA